MSTHKTEDYAILALFFHPSLKIVLKSSRLRFPRYQAAWILAEPYIARFKSIGVLTLKDLHRVDLRSWNLSQPYAKQVYFKRGSSRKSYPLAPNPSEIRYFMSLDINSDPILSYSLFTSPNLGTDCGDCSSFA